MLHCGISAPPPTGLWQRWVMTRKAQAEHISSAISEESRRWRRPALSRGAPSRGAPPPPPGTPPWPRRGYRPRHLFRVLGPPLLAPPVTTEWSGYRKSRAARQSGASWASSQPMRIAMENENSISPKRTAWNKGKLTGAKPPLLARHVWSIRTKLQIEGRTRDLRFGQFVYRGTGAAKPHLAHPDRVRHWLRSGRHGPRGQHESPGW